MQELEMSSPTLPAQSSLRRRVFNLAWPVISENFLETMLGVVDTWLVAGLGAVALAGVGTAIQVMFFIIATLSSISVGSAVLVAQAVGARTFERASALAKQSLVWSIFISLPLILVGVLAGHRIIGIFGVAPEVQVIGEAYLRVTMGTMVVLTLLLIGGGVLRGAGDTRTPMLVTAFANVINIGLAWALIYGKFGLPALGAVGSAWATFIARGIACVLMLYALWRGRNGVSIRGPGGWWPNLPIARQIMGIGIPAAVEQVLISTAFLTLTIVVATLGTATLAAQRVALNAMSVSFLPGFGFGMAATALVGQSIGARRPQDGQAAARIATWWGVAWMGGLGIIFLLFSRQIMGFFTADQQVIEIGAVGLRVVALTQPLWAISFVQAGALRGTGNTNYPLRVNVAGMWLAVGLSTLFITYVSQNLGVVWVSFLITSPVTAFLLWRRFNRVISSPLVPVNIEKL